MADDDALLPDYGPAMLKLSERRRLFVLALVQQEGRPNLTAAAKAAGFSDRSYGSLRVRAHTLAHDPDVIAALHEEARRRFPLFGLFGVKGLARIANSPKHPEHYKACKDLADRFGFAAVTEHKVTVERTDRTGEAMAARIRELAAALGMDAGQLLGENAVAPMKLIEGETVKQEVADGRHDQSVG